jgi:hypothetical protein
LPPAKSVVFAGCSAPLAKVACGAFADIGFVAAGKKRGFCRLLSAIGKSRLRPKLPSGRCAAKSIF